MDQERHGGTSDGKARNNEVRIVGMCEKMKGWILPSLYLVLSLPEADNCYSGKDLTTDLSKDK